MAIYTTELRTICESKSGEISQAYNIDNIISISIPYIFDEFPIFDDTYRNVLCSKILKHFYTREIGFETFGLWKLKLNTKLQEIMPYYNQMYKSALIEFNPLEPLHIETSKTVENAKNRREDNSENSLAKGKADNITINETADSSNKLDKYSETPQGTLEGVENGDYLTNARKIEDSTERNQSVKNNASTTQASTLTGNTQENINTVEKYLETIKGNNTRKDFGELLVSARNSFINVDLLVIDELEELFIQLW